jgi:hypothetical protein
MPACPHHNECALLSRTLAQMPILAEIYRRLYCTDAWCLCARYTVLKHLGAQRIPPSLFPFEGDRAALLMRLG